MKIIKIPKKDVIYEIAHGWASPDDRGFKVYADELGASIYDQSGWVVYEEGSEEDGLIRTPYLEGELSWEDLLDAATCAISRDYNFEGEFLLLEVEED